MKEWKVLRDFFCLEGKAHSPRSWAASPWNGISHKFSPQKPAGCLSHVQGILELHRLDSAQLLSKYCEGGIYITHHTAHHCCPHSHCHYHNAIGCECSIHSDMRTHLPHTPVELQGHNRDKVKARQEDLACRTPNVWRYKSSNNHPPWTRWCWRADSPNKYQESHWEISWVSLFHSVHTPTVQQALKPENIGWRK